MSWLLDGVSGPPLGGAVLALGLGFLACETAVKNVIQRRNVGKVGQKLVGGRSALSRFNLG